MNECADYNRSYGVSGVTDFGLRLIKIDTNGIS